ncbi:MAG TPA: plastocyanin/azurin family copper-binding protein, partial [Thermoanaerobaculia bacterium]|nr:plastocyanin/azurin family copper-binding protein [Thermoanaerobaculia bacterium]
VVNVGQGGSFFKDAQSGTTTTNIRVGDTVLWNWVNDKHSTTSGVCTGGGGYDGYGSSCNSDGNWDSGTMTAPASFSQRFDTAGTFRYYCMVHTSAMTGTIQVNP